MTDIIFRINQMYPTTKDPSIFSPSIRTREEKKRQDKGDFQKEESLEHQKLKQLTKYYISVDLSQSFQDTW